MKAKLNLTIDEDIVYESKAYAQMRGQSVSQLVEDLLRGIVSNRKKSFSKKWRGKFEAVEKDEERYRKLKKRYKL